MNWDAIGAVGEILGEIAVVVTLGYLAVQLKLARVASQVQSTYSSHESYSRWRVALLQNPELPKILAKANRQESLTEEEEITITTLSQELFSAVIVSIATNERSAIFYDISTEVKYLVKTLAENPGLVPCWHSYKELIRSISPRSVQAIDEALPESSAHTQ